MIQRWDDLTPEEQQRYTDAEQLRTQLAAASTRAEAAEAQLAAIPIDEITFLWRFAPRNSASQRACMRVGDWLQSRR